MTRNRHAYRMPQLLAALGAAIVVTLAQPVLAESADKTTVAAEKSTPDTLIRDVAQTVLSRIKADQDSFKQDPAKLYAMVDKLILPHFDFPLMGRLVLGKQWTEASESQQQRFLDSFKTLLVKTYGNALLQYSNETIDFRPAEMGSKPGRASVSSIITSDGSNPVTMEYRMRLLDERWLVYDVVVDNISLVTNYRGTYAAEIQRGGLEGLISKLEDQISG